MRVALVSPYDLDRPGGVQSHVRALAGALVRAGDRVLVVGPGRPAAAGPAGRGSGDGAVPDGPVEVRVGPGRAVAFNGSRAPILLDPRGVRRARRAIAAFAPDVVHVHEPLAPLLGLAVAWGVARRPGGPSLVVTHHAWSDRARLYRAAAPVGRRILARAGGVIAVSEAAAAYHAAALGVPRSRFTVVPNGVDVGRFARPRTPRAPDDPLTVLFLGRLERRKGVLVLAEAYAALRRRRGDLALVVVGTGPDEAEARRALAADTTVRFLGAVAQDRLPGVLAEADVVVAPSLGGESFGIVLLEAMASGAALVASDLPGYRSVVDPDHALLVPPGDVDALAAAVGRLADDAALRQRLAAAGHVRVADFDWAEVAGRVRRVHAAAVGRTVPPPPGAPPRA